MDPLDLVKLRPLMKLTSGRPEVMVGLIDGAVAMHHPDLAAANVSEAANALPAACARTESVGCIHGTLVAGMLFAKSGW